MLDRLDELNACRRSLHWVATFGADLEGSRLLKGKQSIDFVKVFLCSGKADADAVEAIPVTAERLQGLGAIVQQQLWDGGHDMPGHGGKGDHVLAALQAFIA